MSKPSSNVLLWSPRILAMAVCLFLTLFALDSPIPDFLIHLAPIFVLLAVVGLSFRWEWVGGLVFTGVAVAYGYVARDHVSWILCIAVPLLMVGILYFWSWIHRRQRSATV